MLDERAVLFLALEKCSLCTFPGGYIQQDTGKDQLASVGDGAGDALEPDRLPRGFYHAPLKIPACPFPYNLVDRFCESGTIPGMDMVGHPPEKVIVRVIETEYSFCQLKD